MNARRISAIVTLTFVLGLVMPLPFHQGIAEARSAGSSKATSKRASDKAASRTRKTSSQATNRRPGSKKKAQARKKKVCTTRQGKRQCRWVAQFDGHGVADSKLREEPLPQPSGEVWLFSANLREEVKVNIYNEQGEIDHEALAQLDSVFRCKRTGEERAVDPRLYEILSLVYDHFGQQRIELVSGFRNQPNQGSRHFHASAMDIRISGVSAQKLYQFATSLDTGGMGIGLYPSSGFVHIDWRAPGEKSYRWTDYSGPGEDAPKKRRPSRKRQPNS